MSRMRPEQVILINKKITNMQLLSIQSLTKQAALTVSPEALWNEARKRELWPWCQRCSVGSVPPGAGSESPLGAVAVASLVCSPGGEWPPGCCCGGSSQRGAAERRGVPVPLPALDGQFSHCCSSWDLDRELGLAGVVLFWGYFVVFLPC